MRLKKIEITQYRNLKNVTIDLEKNDYSSVYALASVNGGGKSTLLQFVFTLLRCFTVSSKQVYIQNLLADVEWPDKEHLLARFIFEKANEQYELSFSVIPTDNKNDLDFDSIPDLQAIQHKIRGIEVNIILLQGFLHLQDALIRSKKVTEETKRELKELKHKYTFNSEQLNDLYLISLRTDSFEAYMDFFRAVRKQILEDKEEIKSLQPELTYQKEKKEQLERNLLKAKRFYIAHINNNEHVLLASSDAPRALHHELSHKVYLNAPTSQIFHFLSNSEKQQIFNALESQSSNSYEEAVTKAKEQLGRFFTYDFTPSRLILQAFETAFEHDNLLKRQSGSYGDHYDKLQTELSAFLPGKNISIDEKMTRVIYSLKDTGKELSPADLSHGELKKLSLFVWLKYIIEPDTIILMDEVDIALHPSWQYQLTKELPTWSKNSQFILATHSPQILSSTYYKNIIKLVVNDGQTGIEQLSEPPLDRDINTTVTEVMGAADMPKELKALHKEYRKLVEEGKIDSKEAKKLKQELLQHESENSAFFQDINFDLDML